MRWGEERRSFKKKSIVIEISKIIIIPSWFGWSSPENPEKEDLPKEEVEEYVQKIRKETKGKKKGESRVLQRARRAQEKGSVIKIVLVSLGHGRARSCLAKV